MILCETCDYAEAGKLDDLPEEFRYCLMCGGRKLKEPPANEWPPVKCDICKELIMEDIDVRWAYFQENHSGFLGNCHPSCYDKLCDQRPETPFTDPISGETDWHAMNEAFDIDDGTELGEDDFC